jgi:hypothetical protein
VTKGPLSGEHTRPPLIHVTTTENLVQPEYDSLFYIDVEFQDESGGEWYGTRALLDCGSQGSCINERISKTYLNSHTLKASPTGMIMADGSSSAAGPITHYDPIRLRIGGNEEPYGLDIAPLSHEIILGAPWLRRHNPTVDFREGRLTFQSEYCRYYCKHFEKTETLHRQPKPVTSTNMTTTKNGGERKARPQAKTKTKAPKVAMISAAAFSLICNQPETELYFVSMKPTPEGDLAINVASQGDVDLSTIPPEYHDFADLFSKKGADKLPPHQRYDHTIPLQPGSTPHFGPIYKLSPVELETLRKYIDENLKKGFIKNSQSPYGAPIVFAKKKDGSLRLCVDYRGLNKLTIKNRYPLPLIGELLDRISKATIFSKFDIRDGYNRLRMAEGEEEKTAFRCRYGLFEYTVMPFGLCNAPGTFQHYMNETFREFLDKFLVIYLDDFLVYSNSLKEHKIHVRQILERLREAGLYLKPSKCQFHAEEVEFLGFIIGKNGVAMDPGKVDSITSWPTPKSVHDIRMFLGLANFYRRFIKDFSKLAAPMTSLLKKENNKNFRWTESAQAAFDKLRTAFTTAPILQHFDPELPTILEADASDFALGAVISQKGPDGLVHPIAFHSRKFNPAELNYEIYDKEMLAIVESLEHHRHYFEGLGQQATIYSDHHNLLWFTETKVYNRRQARWAEKISKYDFVIIFRPGKEGGKPDALSRRPDYKEQAQLGDRTMTFLKPEQVDTSAIKERSQETKISAQSARTELREDMGLKQAILDALPRDPTIGEYLNHLRDPTMERDEEATELLEPFAMEEDGLVTRNGLVYVPAGDGIKLQILRGSHDSKTAGHLGQEKTMELITREYYWPGMRKFVNEYIRTCETCARNKTSRRQRHGQLHPLPIPEGPWQSVSMDFIVELPPSQGYDTIYVCVDRFTKMAHFCPTTTKISAEGTADLYLRHVFKNHGIPRDIVSDRGPQFVSKFTRALLDLCDIQGNRSTAFHPESDGQTERVNQTLEQYLRTYCGHHQDDWSQLLPLAEFVYNNAKSASTGMSPFYANYGYHPRHTIKVKQNHQDNGTMNPSAEALRERFDKVHKELREHLEGAQQAYKRSHDRKTREPPLFRPGDLVWLNRTNIKTTRPSQKLDRKRMGPFKIMEAVGESKLAFRLELPRTMRIHPVFHVRLLDQYHPNKVPGRTQPPPPPELVEGEAEYTVSKILDSRIRRNKLEYLVDWEGYSEDERTWEPAMNMEGAQEAVAEFHRQYPHRPANTDIPRRR